MAFGTTTKRSFISTYGNNFVRRVQEGTEGAQQRTLKNGKEVWEVRYDYVSGTIISMKIKEVEFGNAKRRILEIEMADMGDEFTLSLPADSSHAFNFYNRMENINYGKQVEFAIWEYNERPYMGVKQDDQMVPKKYEKDDIPDWVAKEVNGQKMWDKSDALNFFAPKLETAMKEILVNGNTPKDPLSKSTVDENTEDDLPF